MMMMNMTEIINNTFAKNMSDEMAEDSGIMELRNPEVSGMHKKGWFARLFGKD